MPDRVGGRAARHREALVCTPDGKGARSTPGVTVPIRHLAGGPAVATIDWSRL